MRLNIKAFSIACSLIWGSALLVIGIAHAIWPNYGQLFLELIASVYPGYHSDSSVGSIIVGTVYGLFDGGIGGALFAWIYNLSLKCCTNEVV